MVINRLYSDIKYPILFIYEFLFISTKQFKLLLNTNEGFPKKNLLK